MNNTHTLIISFFVFSITLLLGYNLNISQYHKEKKIIKDKIDQCLKSAVELDFAQHNKDANIPQYIHTKEKSSKKKPFPKKLSPKKPSKKGTGIRIITINGTVFYPYKNEQLRNETTEQKQRRFRENTLSYKYPIKVDTLNKIFNAELAKFSIEAKTAISYSCRDSFAISPKNLVLPKDTNCIAAEYRGINDMIEIKGYVSYSPFLILKKINWTILIILGIEAFIAFVLLWKNRKKHKQQTAVPIEDTPSPEIEVSTTEAKVFPKEVEVSQTENLSKGIDVFPKEIKALDGENFQIGDYTYNLTYRRLSIGNKEKILNPQESKILRLLLKSVEVPITKDVFCMQLWPEDVPSNHYDLLHTLITKLRNCIKEDSSLAIKNIPKKGYYICILPPEDTTD